MRKPCVFVVTAGLLAGCGVTPVGPDRLQGSPPTVAVAPSVYWVTADRKLLGVVAVGKGPAGTITNNLVQQLLAGPIGVQAMPRLTSELPEIPADEGLGVTVAARGSGPVTVGLPYDVSRLSRMAVGQVVCTVWSAEAARRGSIAQVEVVLTGSGRRSGPYRCTNFPTSADSSA